MDPHRSEKITARPLGTNRRGFEQCQPSTHLVVAPVGQRYALLQTLPHGLSPADVLNQSPGHGLYALRTPSNSRPVRYNSRAWRRSSRPSSSTIDSKYSRSYVLNLRICVGVNVHGVDHARPLGTTDQVVLGECC